MKIRNHFMLFRIKVLGVVLVAGAIASAGCKDESESDSGSSGPKEEATSEKTEEAIESSFSTLVIEDFDSPASLGVKNGSIAISSNTFTQAVTVELSSLKKGLESPDKNIILLNSLSYETFTDDDTLLPAVQIPILVSIRVEKEKIKIKKNMIVYGDAGPDTATILYKNKSLSIEDSENSLEYIVSFYTDLATGRFSVGELLEAEAEVEATQIIEKTEDIFGNSPKVSQIFSPQSNLALKEADTLIVSVSFDRPVEVTGNPTLSLDTGGDSLKVATYLGGSGEASINFSYTVQSGDNASSVDYSAVNAIDLQGGTIRAVEGFREAILTLPAPGGAKSLSASTIRLDTTAPVWSSSITHAVSFPVLTESPEISWEQTATDESGSEIDRYEYSLGISQGATDTVDWTPMMQAPFSLSGLSLTDNTTYYVNMRAIDNAGNSSAVLSSNGWTANNQPLDVLPVYPNNGANINDYVQANGTDSACLGSATHYSQCINGGLFKKVEVPAETSCDGLTLVDELGIFWWSCEDTTGQAIFYSREIQPSKGLQHTIDTASDNFLDNRVILSGRRENVSLPDKWWTNPVVELPDNASPVNHVNLITPTYGEGTIFYFTDDRVGGGFTLQVPKSAILGIDSPGVSPHIDMSNATGGLFDIQSDYCWLEIRIYGANNSTASLTSTAAFVRLRNVSFFQIFGSTTNFTMDTPTGIGEYLKVQNDDNSGRMSINGLLAHSHISNNSNQNNSTLVRNIFTNGSAGKNATTSVGSLHFNAESSLGSSVEQTHHNLVFVNSSSDLGAGIGGDDSAISDSAFYWNTRNINAEDTEYLKIQGSVIFDQADLTDKCSVAIGTVTNPGIDLDCNLIGNSTANVIDGSADYATTITSFVGESVDSVNPNSGVTGVALYDNSSAFNWGSFENPYRSWINKDNSAVIDNSRVTNSGEVQIYDFRLKQNDTVLRNRLVPGGEIFTAGAPCPASVTGNNVLTDQKTIQNTFLRHAFEMVTDGVGDDDGLCESNEHCLYAPNLGPYQGEGNPWSNECVFQDGTISNVRMFAHPINGVPE